MYHNTTSQEYRSDITALALGRLCMHMHAPRIHTRYTGHEGLELDVGAVVGFEACVARYAVHGKFTMFTTMMRCCSGTNFILTS